MLPEQQQQCIKRSARYENLTLHFTNEAHRANLFRVQVHFYEYIDQVNAVIYAGIVLLADTAI